MTIINQREFVFGDECVDALLATVLFSVNGNVDPSGLKL
jgi:hypothetical protein